MNECQHCSTCYDDLVEVCPADAAPLARSIPGTPVIDGKYRVERRLAAGGMGVIYRVCHLALQRRFALKLISTRRTGGDTSFLERFRIEAAALGNLRHPNIVDVTDFGIDPRGGGLPYLVMEFLQGTSLEHYLRLKGSLPPDEVIALLAPAASAIDYAHEHGVLHRDLKPGNLFLARSEDGTPAVKLVDFGLARRARHGEEAGSFSLPATLSSDWLEADPHEPTSRFEVTPTQVATQPVATLIAETDAGGGLTAAGIVVGTPGYVAPEVIHGQRAGPTSDIYALGMIAHVLLTGRLPFHCFGQELLRTQVQQDPPAPSSKPPEARQEPLPAELDAPLLRIIARDPHARPATARDAVRELREAWQRAQLRRWRARELPKRSLMAAGLALIAMLLSPALWRWEPVAALERTLLDLRYAALPLRAPDPRLAVVTFDDETLHADATLLSDRADEIGRALDHLFDAGARGVVVDMLLVHRWSESMPFSQFILRHPGRVAFAVQTDSRGNVLGADAVEGLTAVALGPERTKSLFGFAELTSDRDGVVRRAVSYFRDPDGQAWPSLATKAAAMAGPINDPPATFSIDHSIDAGRYPRVSWRDLGGCRFDGRIVMVGADFTGSGDERHRLPDRVVSGPIVQAMIADTILHDFPIRDVQSPLIAVLAGLACGAVAFALLTRRRWRGVAVGALAAAAVYLLAAWLVFITRERILPMAGPIVSLALTAAAAFVLRRNLAPFVRAEEEES